jgi:hypothetical protein
VLLPFPLRHSTLTPHTIHAYLHVHEAAGLFSAPFVVMHLHDDSGGGVEAAQLAADAQCGQHPAAGAGEQRLAILLGVLTPHVVLVLRWHTCIGHGCTQLLPGNRPLCMPLCILFVGHPGKCQLERSQALSPVSVQWSVQGCQRRERRL